MRRGHFEWFAFFFRFFFFIRDELDVFQLFAVGPELVDPLIHFAFFFVLGGDVYIPNRRIFRCRITGFAFAVPTIVDRDRLYRSAKPIFVALARTLSRNSSFAFAFAHLIFIRSVAHAITPRRQEFPVCSESHDPVVSLIRHVDVAFIPRRFANGNTTRFVQCRVLRPRRQRPGKRMAALRQRQRRGTAHRKAHRRQDNRHNRHAPSAQHAVPHPRGPSDSQPRKDLPIRSPHSLSLKPKTHKLRYTDSDHLITDNSRGSSANRTIGPSAVVTVTTSLLPSTPMSKTGLRPTPSPRVHEAAKPPPR